MKARVNIACSLVLVWLSPCAIVNGADDDDVSSPRKAFINGTGIGWRKLQAQDFVNANCAPDTWTWNENSVHCTGKPIGVLRSVQQYTNFELVAEWRHLSEAGNSGIFVWTNESAFRDLQPSTLPRGGIEVQILDHGFTKWYEKSTGKKGDWFTTNGDVFVLGTATMKPFPPMSKNGDRSFPRKQLSRGFGEWNYYYIRCINGEVRLWVNGEEVSGGTDCNPRRGYLCLESEGSPIDFRNLRIRTLN